MSYLDVDKFFFNNKSLRGFCITEIDELKIDIKDIEVIFSKNRTIVFKIVTENLTITRYLNKNKKYTYIKGTYYHYSFIATIDNVMNSGFHSPFSNYNIVIDLIDFSKKATFFINSKDNYELNIIPTENMTKYIDRRGKKNFLKFEDITFSDYEKKYRYLLELNSFIYDTPILIEKVYLKNKNRINILFQSQNINENINRNLSEEHPIVINGHFSYNLDKYLEYFIKFRKSQKTLDLLLKIYLISDLLTGKENYHLNDISGFIDLFDGIFVELKIELENINDSKTQRNKLSNDYNLENKIIYILDMLEPSLKYYKIDENKELIKVLANFRNMIRHQNTFKTYNLDKLYTFSKGILKLYVIKFVLNISDEDYDINRILSNFNIHQLVCHKYKYLDKEIIIYNTRMDNYNHKVLTNSSTYYKTLISYPMFKDAKESDFIYDNGYTHEIKKIYIDDNDRIRRALIFFGIITVDDKILQLESIVYNLDLSYDELMKNLNK